MANASCIFFILDECVSLRDAIFLVTGTLLAFVAGLVGAWIQRKIDQHAAMRPINQIFNFNRAYKLFIIFPDREYVDTSNPHKPVVSILPRTSTEDFLAMNNMVSALLNTNWKHNIVRSTQQKDKNKEVNENNFNYFDVEDLKGNLVIICSPKSNPLAALVQEKLVGQNLPIFRFERIQPSGNWSIIDKAGAPHTSDSFEQEEKYKANGVGIEDMANQSFDDWAVVTKCSNPWNPRTKILMVAGIRGIGTWGAAECVKKSWGDIYSMLRRHQKDVDFSALVKIHYERSDITDIDVQRVETYN